MQGVMCYRMLRQGSIEDWLSLPERSTCKTTSFYSRYPYSVSEKISWRCIIIIITIIEFLTSQLWLGNIHLSWDVVINRIRPVILFVV